MLIFFSSAVKYKSASKVNPLIIVSTLKSSAVRRTTRRISKTIFLHPKIIASKICNSTIFFFFGLFFFSAWNNRMDDELWIHKIRNSQVESNGNRNPFLIWSRFADLVNILKVFRRCTCRSLHCRWMVPFGRKIASVSIFNEQSNYTWLIITRHTTDYGVVVSHNNLIFIAALCFSTEYEEMDREGEEEKNV